MINIGVSNSHTVRFHSVKKRLVKKPAVVITLLVLLVLVSCPLFAQEQTVSDDEYRSFFGMDSRIVIWIIAQMHLMFAAFVLGVPIFAVIVEVIGAKTKDLRYDRLGHEFTKLLSAAFSTTAALGALLTFTLFGLFPSFMQYMTGIFHGSMYVYALLFFGEAFCLYLYYYSWDRLKDRKGVHISIGILLNLFGITLMAIANSWTSFMMTPAGVNPESRQLLNFWEAFANPLWIPLNIHRLIANVCFAGFIVGAYGAVKFLSAKTEGEKAHYDWMGYMGNLIGVAALIPLPFAGYLLGREIYNYSPVMGNISMGGAFSWSFIIQAILVGMTFIGANFYLWSGMGRIPGSERYIKYIKYLNVILVVCFAIWLTPHNLPLSSEEQMIMGGQYHPVLKYLGLMSGKNAAVNFIILSTFLSFLIYRRGNKSKLTPFSDQGKVAKIVLVLMGAFCIVLLGAYAYRLITMNPAALELAVEKKKYFILPVLLLILQMAAIVTAVALTFKNKGKLGQALFVGVTILSCVFILGVYGYVVMVKANAFLQNIAVIQVFLVVTCLILTTTIDVFLFRKAQNIGGIRWGRMPVRAQYTLILLCVTNVLVMGLMGYVRSGLREDWHVYGILRDTSKWAFTPSMAYMSRVVAVIVLLFLGLVSFVFWLGGLGERKSSDE